MKKRDNQESCSILLEEQIGEFSGMVTGQKVLDIEEEECTSKIEVSISGSGNLEEWKLQKCRLTIVCTELMDLSMVKEKV